MKTVKVVGISGSGKTTIINSICQNDPGILHLCYSEYLKEFGKNADSEWKKFLQSNRGNLILIDEHLEFGEDDLIEIYKQENTKGIILLNISESEVLKRINGDVSRKRDLDFEEIKKSLVKSRLRALYLSNSLDIPMIEIGNRSINETVQISLNFINSLNKG